jgi:hypothetical protein
VQALNFDASDATAVHFDDGKAIAIKFEGFAATRDETELGHDETADGGVGGILGKHDVVLGVEVADVESGVEDDRAIGRSTTSNSS